jgi:thioredoxin 1
MNRQLRMLILVVLGLAIVLILFSKSNDDDSTVSSAALADEAVQAGLPRIVCLGAGACVPCMMMEPVREELRTEFAGRLVVQFHDVWKDKSIGRHYGIRGIPTTIFYDAEGNERGRAEGFVSKEHILAGFAELGIEIPEIKHSLSGEVN